MTMHPDTSPIHADRDPTPPESPQEQLRTACARLVIAARQRNRALAEFHAAERQVLDCLDAEGTVNLPVTIAAHAITMGRDEEGRLTLMVDPLTRLD